MFFASTHSLLFALHTVEESSTLLVYSVAFSKDSFPTIEQWRRESGVCVRVLFPLLFFVLIFICKRNYLPETNEDAENDHPFSTHTNPFVSCFAILSSAATAAAAV